MPTRSRRSGRWLGTALSACLVGGCAGPPSAPADGTPAIIQLLSPLGIDVPELGIRDLDAPVDPWRLRIVDHLLAQPLDAVATVRGMAAEFRARRGSLASIVTEAASLLDVSLPAPRPAPAARGPVEDALATLPLELSAIVRDLLRAMAEAAPLIRGAFAGLDLEDRAFVLSSLLPADAPVAALDESPAWRFVELAERVDRAALLDGAAVVAAAVGRAVAALRGWRGHVEPRAPDPAWRAVAEGDVVLVVETPLGPLVIGGPGPTTYRGDAALIIDLGGDDTYFGHAAAALGPERPIAIVIDLGGNDRYVATVDVAQGAGAFGVGILVDLDGDDTYVGRNVAQGAGAFGVGILLDAHGHDRYEARAQAQGAAAFGLGALIDEGGDDRYQAAIYAQGFGGTAGLGLLLDEGGDDAYTLGGGPPDARQPDHVQTFGQGFGSGLRPLASGGIGLLIDARGSDRYRADYFAQGASYWYGLGALVDEAGDDEYVATRYAQGAGIHFSVGVLWDGGGDDRYRSSGVSQGVGHDYGVGILADAAGNDLYEASWLSQGAGNFDGLGLLIDGAGNDRYQAEGADVQGYGRAARRSQTFGFLIDLGGADTYSRPMADCLEWSGSGWGGRLDVEATALGFSWAPRRADPGSLAAASPAAVPRYRRPDDPRFAPRDAEEQRVQALLQDVTDPGETATGAAAREAGRRGLEALGPSAIPALVRLLGSLDAAVTNEAAHSLIGLGAVAHAALLERLEAPNWFLRRRAAYVVAQRPTPDAARALWARVAGDPDPRLRAFGAEALARACLPEARGTLARLLAGDPSLSVRHAAVRGLASLGGTEAERAPALAD
ncbi:MAG: HEAT repeat domain-containing protein, partial [Candidatus Rokubacteria bacterium]|nr:HEAT repeat domain-containing protein [Candidatus Rokubacteria bacterium]